MADELTLCVLIDYQNIHLTARDIFAPPGTLAEATVVHPLAFAEKLVEVRAASQRVSTQGQVRLEAVRVYRGAPSNHHEPTLYSVAQRQRAFWTRDPRVKMIYRTLRYPNNWGSSTCHERPREKGIDVLLALDLVDLAMEGTYDIVVLATHDTDLEPAIERALHKPRSKIETAGWDGARRLKPQGQTVWHTHLSGSDYIAVRDRRTYR
jgi:uncharacterized LabA/DUF88 family protein